MPQDFYSLEQAAERLGVSTDRLNEMSRRREVRSFTDRGTQRFRKQEIDELARQRGMGSDVDLQLGDSSAEQVAAGPPGTPPAQGSDLFPFNVPGVADTGVAVFPAPPGGAKQAPGSDNEVKLVSEGSSLELEVKGGEASSSSAVQLSGGKGKKGKTGESGKLATDHDSDVKLVDEGSVVDVGREDFRPGSDSDVRLDDLGSGSGLMPDSGVRLVDDHPPSSKARKSEIASPTEEINLDEELRRMEEALSPDAPKAKEHKSQFELGSAPPSSGKLKRKPDSSSDFDFSAALPPRSDDSVELDLGMDLARDVTAGSGTSGINLAKPSDSGRSLEGSDEDSITFELEPEGSPRKAKTPPRGQPAPVEVDSSSEFELTLDDDSGVAPMGSSSANKPIRTDKVLGSKEDDSGSDELRLGPGSSSDLNLETSDFELALDEDPAQGAGETGSEVIVIDEGAEEGDATAVRPEALDALEAEELPELAEDEELSVEAAADDEAVVPAGPVVEAAPADWGWWSIIHLPTALILLFVGFLLIEMMRSIWSYNQPTLVGSKIFEMFAGMLK